MAAKDAAMAPCYVASCNRRPAMWHAAIRHAGKTGWGGYNTARRRHVLAKFTEQFIQQVAQATDIVELVSRYVTLKKRGAEYVGLCPFHDDKRPSLNVSPAKQIFKCFACGAGGGVFKFIELYDKLTFPEAVRELAERANIPLPRDSRDAPQPAGGLSKNDLIKVTTWAADFFRRQLQSPGGRDAMEYAHKRGLTDETIKRFGLGYAPDFWDALLRAGTQEGFSQEQLLTAGLIKRREEGDGCYDRMRNRLIFPILDVNSNVIGFGGRALEADAQAKYLNSPETPLYDKSAQLYALNWAREAIAASDQAVVVEGYMDAVIPHQGGVRNVVASLGTALTDRQARLLGRYTREIVLIYDADVAGQAAAERALEIFLQQQLHVRVATIPDGKDPCDYVLAHGGEAFKQLIDAAPDALEFVWRRRAQQIQQARGNLAQQRVVVDEFLRLVVACSSYGAIDGIRRGQLAQHIAHLLQVPAEEVSQQMRQLHRAIPRANMPATQPRQAAAVSIANAPRAERHVLEVLLNEPSLLDNVLEQIGPVDFVDPVLAAIAAEVWSRGLAGGLKVDQLLASSAMAPYSGVLADLIDDGARRGNYEQTLAGAVEFMVYRRKRRQIEALKAPGLDDESLRKLGEDCHGGFKGRALPPR